MNATIMTVRPVEGMTAAEMRTEAALYRSLAEHADPATAAAFQQVAGQIDQHVTVAEQAEADAMDAYLAGVSTTDLRAALDRRRQQAVAEQYTTRPDREWMGG